MINVTEPFLPPQSEYSEYLEKIWKKNWLTNNGPLLNELELKLKDYLDLSHLLYVTNGTVAIQLAIKALNLSGEVITTPFSYVATTSSIVWENCTPVFVDIDATTFNINPNLIEQKITNKTTAIIATHVFGNPCDVLAIEKIAKANNLKVIYDAAHGFGTRINGRSILSYGDISTISFHATKLFHTIEGGAVVTASSDLTKKLALMRNFGHNGPEVFEGAGINAKNSEFHAAMGLCNLKHIESIIDKRKSDYTYYLQKLKNLKVEFQEIVDKEGYNYSYFPILFKDEQMLQKSVKELNDQRISPRRYFFPSLSKLPYVKEQNTPVADNIASRILCLPMSHTLTLEDIDMICRILLRAQNH